MNQRKIRILLISVGILIWAGLALHSYSFFWKDAVPSFQNTVVAGNLLVQLSGEVKSPGIYAFREGDTYEDVIAAAGGLTDQADISELDLSASCTDGSTLSVPKKKTASSTTKKSSTKTTSSKPKVSLPLDINTATAEELCALSGIGEVLAGRIVEYREQNGPFGSVDDLINVKGIGEKKLEAIRPDVYISITASAPSE